MEPTPIDPKSLPVTQRIRLLVKALNGAQRTNTPPIRDWVWWKNKEAVLTIGDDKPRYQQDGGQGRREPPEGRRRFLGLF